MDLLKISMGFNMVKGPYRMLKRQMQPEVHFRKLVFSKKLCHFIHFQVKIIKNMRVLARSRSDGLLSLWSLTNGNFHDSFETESKVKNFIDRQNVAGLAWLSALKFIETKQKGLAKHCWMIYKILYFQGLNNLSFNFKKWRTCSSRSDNFQ